MNSATRTSVLLLAVAGCICGCNSDVETPAQPDSARREVSPLTTSSPEPQSDTVDHTDTADEKPIVIDVRTEGEYSQGHVEGAVLIPHDQIREKISEVVPKKDARILLYCHSGKRAGLALETLKNLGYSNVESLGGLEDARQALQ